MWSERTRTRPGIRAKLQPLVRKIGGVQLNKPTNGTALTSNGFSDPHMFDWSTRAGANTVMYEHHRWGIASFYVEGRNARCGNKRKNGDVSRIVARTE